MFSCNTLHNLATSYSYHSSHICTPKLVCHSLFLAFHMLVFLLPFIFFPSCLATLENSYIPLMLNGLDNMLLSESYLIPP